MAKEEITLKIGLLKKYDKLARLYFSEEHFETWLMLGVPDEADDNMLETIAYDREEFNRIMRLFGALSVDEEEEDEGDEGADLESLGSNWW